MRNDISVGLGEIKISKEPEDVLVAFGLGSCVGVSMYDPLVKVGGLLHAVLPISNGKDTPTPKYADSGIELLIDQLMKTGANRTRLLVKMAGGANMLTAPGLSQTFDIGTRNIDAARTVLKKFGLKIINEEVGGQIGRTVRLYVANGRVTIRTMGGQERDF